jgi:hypothetical protein
MSVDFDIIINYQSGVLHLSDTGGKKGEYSGTLHHLLTSRRPMTQSGEKYSTAFTFNFVYP